MTATGESTAAHPTPLVDPSLATPPLFRLSDTRRVQAAHLDLAQQSYQPGTVATSSPSTKGFGTDSRGDKSDKTDKAKKSRPANFAPVTTAEPFTVAVPAPPSAASGDERTVRRPAATSTRPARDAEPVDAIHALASAGPAAPVAATLLGGAAPHVPAVRLAVPGTERDELSPSRDITATSAIARDELTEAARDAKRSSATAPAAEARPDRREPTAVVAAEKAPAPAAASTHTPAAPPSASQTPATPSAGPQAPLAAQPLYELATADQSLHATALGNNAHLHMDTGAAGALSLHLSVRDGVADLEVEGPAAERLKLRPEELRRALAGEGLALGHFVSRANEASDTRSQQDDASSRNGSGQNGNDRGANTPDAAPRPTATPFAAQSGASSYGGENRRNWQGETPDSADRERSPGAPPANGTPTTAGDATPARRRGVHVTA